MWITLFFIWLFLNKTVTVFFLHINVQVNVKMMVFFSYFNHLGQSVFLNHFFTLYFFCLNVFLHSHCVIDEAPVSHVGLLVCRYRAADVINCNQSPCCDHTPSALIGEKISYYVAALSLLHIGRLSISKPEKKFLHGLYLLHFCMSAFFSSLFFWPTHWNKACVYIIIVLILVCKCYYRKNC